MSSPARNSERASPNAFEFFIRKLIDSCGGCVPLPDVLSRRFSSASASNSKAQEKEEDQPVYIRFENQSGLQVSVFWLSHSGETTFFYNLYDKCSISQESYAGNVWLVRGNGTSRLLKRVKVDDTFRQLCLVEKPPTPTFSADSALDEYTIADEVIPACYTKRFYSRFGIPIVGHPQVCNQALVAAKEITECMLKGCSKNIIRELRRYNCKIAVIARDQVTTDILEHSHLRGSPVPDGRNWDTQVRGLGGTKVCPTCSVGEENVLRCPDDKYAKESILIHEFAHTIMEVAFDKQMYQKVLDCYNKNKSRYSAGTYMVTDEKEYWAEGSESWFNASLRHSVNDGINTREKLRAHDAELASLMEEVYGNGSWRYSFAQVQTV